MQKCMHADVVCVCVCAGPAVLHPCDGPHHSEGICDGLLPHTDRRAQSPGLRLSQESLRHCRHQVSLTFYTRASKPVTAILSNFLCNRGG